jgi:hypothetical protein
LYKYKNVSNKKISVINPIFVPLKSGVFCIKINQYNF